MDNYYEFDNSNPSKIPVSAKWNNSTITNTLTQMATNLRWCKVLGVSPQSVISNPAILAPLVGNLSESFHNVLVRDRVNAFALRDSYGKEWFGDSEVDIIEALTGNWNAQEVCK